MPDDLSLVLDSPDDSVLPLHFRRADGPYVKPGSPVPTRAGLNRVRASGSHQFSEDELAKLAQSLPSGTTVVDLRQESHGFVNGIAVSWYAPKDFANIGQALPVIEADEARRLKDLRNAGKATILKIMAKDDQGRISASEPFRVSVESVNTEAGLIRSKGLIYDRIPVLDHAAPADADVDHFLDIWRRTHPNGWLHFHCHAGEGRTTAFLAMADMLVNAREVGFEDIVKRQGMLGGLNLLEITPGWKAAYALERREFLRRFHAYAYANPDGRPLTWSEWIKSARAVS
jgi:hypothetical protein